jgi:hypothetical protein
MLKTVNTFKCHKFIKYRFVNLYKNASFCTNRSEGSSYEPPKPENPFKRTFRILGNDIKSAKNKVQSFITRIQDVREAADKTLKSPYRDGIFPDHCDIAVIGGGAIGSSIAYWLKQRAPHGITVTVIEKDPSVNKNILSWGQVNKIQI